METLQETWDSDLQADVSRRAVDHYQGFLTVLMKKCTAYGGMHMRKIVIQQGDEYRAKVETEYDKEAFFAQVYEDAERMIRAIVRDSHERKLKEERKNVKSQSMITDGNNVIVFCGKRGQGKTSAMKTVAYYMENEEIVFPDGKEKLADKAHFYVLETIDPSSLNEDESIVRVLISKMFNKVVELVNDYSKRTQYRLYSEDDIRYALPEHLYDIGKVERAIELAKDDLVNKYGLPDPDIFIFGDPEIVAEDCVRQITLFKLLSEELPKAA